MQLCMDSFTESSPEIRMQKFVQDLHRILHVDFGKISAEVCLQDFSRSLGITMMQNFNQILTKLNMQQQTTLFTSKKTDKEMVFKKKNVFLVNFSTQVLSHI